MNNIDLIIKSLKYYAKNHPGFRVQVKKELIDWEGKHLFKLVFRVGRTRIEEKIKADDINEAYKTGQKLSMERSKRGGGDIYQFSFQEWVLIAVETAKK